MLTATVLYVAVVVLAMGAMLEGSLAFAQISAKHAAQRYAELAIVQARSTLVASVASQVASHAATIAAPPPVAAGPLCASSANCVFNGSTVFSITGTTAGAQSANVSATELQTHPAIAEGRIAATIVETVSSNSGAVLASRTEYITLRTFAISPYVAVDGTTDAAGARDVPYEADAGGCDPAMPANCDANNPAAAASSPPLGIMNPSDTRIRALRQCIDGGTGACAGQPYADGNPSSIATQTPWYNANAQGGGWSR